MKRTLTTALLVVAGCATSPPKDASKRVDTSASALLSELQLGLPSGAFDPNGEADGEFLVGDELRALATTVRARFEELGAVPETAHPRVCDLLWFKNALYASHAVQPIETTGARIHRFGTEQGRWDMVFDWNRDGGPMTRDGGGGGEGFTRIRSIGGRIFVADADTPGPGGYGLSSARYEDYAFVSDERGNFAALAPGMKPPAGSRVLPRAFHTFDVIDYRGAIVASGGTGVYPTGPYPGGLWVGAMDDVELSLGAELGKGVGVLRTTYMHRFAGRLYIGLQNNTSRGRRRAPWDLAVWSGDPLSPSTAPPVLARVTPDGGWLTRRFASDSKTLFWLASGYRGDGRPATLFRSLDGLQFEPVPVPKEFGTPQDIAIVSGTRYLLTERGLYRARGDQRFESMASAPEGDPFGAPDTFCSAPLVVGSTGLFAGGTRSGRVFRVQPDVP